MTTRETELTAQVAVLEAEIERLREALLVAHDLSTATITRLLNISFTPTALNELIEKVERLTIERCAKAVWNSKPSQKAIDEIPAAYQLASLAAIRALPPGQIRLEELL